MSDALVPSRDPALLEVEVVRLREECRALLGELERRYHRLVTFPKRLGEASRAAPRLVLRAATLHPALAFASVAVLLGSALALGYGVRRLARS
jgi:hypothetical protein